MLECQLLAYAPCALLCLAVNSEQLEGFDTRYMSMAQDGRIAVVVQAERENLCTKRLLAPPEPFGGVARDGDGIDPNADALVAHVPLPMPRPPAFEPAAQAFQKVLDAVIETFEGARQQDLPPPPRP